VTTDFDDDLDTMCSGADLPTVSVAFGDITGVAYEDSWLEEALPGVQSRGVVAEQVALSFPTKRFPGMTMGSALTVDGVAYTVIEPRRPQDGTDGAFTHVLLQKTPPAPVGP
jgi:hypothetical protein